ncbi:MAG: alpha/beta fold hydrolase [Bacteroidales bacterium]|nr:alpha/beta fold hydrolase [Bacteroidales bacterium]
MEFFAISNNIPVFISDTQKGDEILVLLHGYLETHYIFSEFVELLEKKYRVISIDLPGHGLSGSNSEVNSMEFCAAVVVEVMDKCKVGRAFVAGHSMGGYVAQACMELYPDRFKGLVLLNSVPFPDSEEKKADREREISLIQSSMLNRIAEISIPKMYDSDNLRNLDEKIQETIELCETHDPKGIVASLRGMMQRKDYSPFIKGLAGKTPTLFIYGNKDKFNPIERINSIIDEFQGIDIRIIQDTGHNSFIEKPEDTMEILERFIENSK